MTEAFPTPNPPTVLIAVNDAFAVAHALPVGRTLARQLGAHLVALYVSPAPLGVDGARKRLQLDASEHADVDLMVRVGVPGPEIVQAAHEENIRLLILVSRGVTNSAVMGSVTMSVVNGCRIPIVLVRPDPALTRQPEIRPIRRLLLPLDGSPATARALRPVSLLAHELGAHLDLLYVAGSAAPEPERGAMSAPRYVDQPHHEWPSWSGEVVDRLCRCLARCPEEVPADVYLAAGDPGTEVPRFASEHDEDAMVLVRKSQIGVGRAKTLLTIFAQSRVPVSIIVTPFRHEAKSISAA